jgi:hypothetical protein
MEKSFFENPMLKKPLSKQRLKLLFLKTSLQAAQVVVLVVAAAVKA